VATVQTEVAPHAGAWIETGQQMHIQNNALVAPHAGAWIETVGLDEVIRVFNRRPSRRGVD